ncbi:MAG TPA: hypothetical protein VNN62_23080 [Methylomirabilota bacterium]|jgi:hypothetical protein|nr:hypothetical protein [Methylomirabilota bacterium]
MDETVKALLNRAKAARERYGEQGNLPPARLVRFPSSHTMGALFVRRVFADGDYAPWEPWGNAQGVVAVPVGKELRLNVTPQASTDLSPLAALHPDDVQYLQLSSTRVNNAGLAHLSKLTGLRVLWLYDTAVSDAGLVHLRSLTGLRVLNLRSTLVTTAGVDALQAALPHCEFRRAWK